MSIEIKVKTTIGTKQRGMNENNKNQLKIKKKLLVPWDLGVMTLTLIECPDVKSRTAAIGVTILFQI